MPPHLIATQRHSHLQPEYALRSEKTRVGRHPDCDVAIMLESVSRFHAEIAKEGNFYILSDLQSRNGTYLNGDRLSAPAPIRQGDRIQFGNVEFIFRGNELTEPSAKEASETNVTFGGRDESAQVIEAKPLDNVAQELASNSDSAADHERAGKLGALYQILLYLRQSDADNPDTLKEVISRLYEVVPADRGVVLLKNKSNDKMEPLTWLRRAENRNNTSPKIVISKSICEEAVRQKAAVLVGDVKSDERFAASDSVATEAISSAICVPLMSGEDVAGLFYVDSQDARHILSTNDLGFIGTLAAEISYALWVQQHDNLDASADAKASTSGLADQLLYGANAMEKFLQQCNGAAPSLSQAISEENLVAAKGFWKQVKSGLKRVNKVVAEMKNFADPKLADFTELDVSKVIKGTLEAFTDEFEDAGIRVELDLEAKAARRKMDEEALYKVFINIVDNTYEALRDHGSGRLAIKMYETQQGALIVELTDNGPGLPAQCLARAFQPFNAGPGSQGIGMGLALTRRYLEAMDASITISSEQSQGAQVTIIFAPSTQC
jgi:signal transduction histidine kinase